LKIAYNKEIRKDPRKHLGSGGPRDIQRRQQLAYEASLKRQAEKGTSIQSGLSFDEIKQKIDEAVEATRREVFSKYSDELNDLNKQLQAAITKISLLEKMIAEKDKIISELTFKLNESGKYADIMSELKNQISDITDKIPKDPVVESDRPQLNDRVFIDPVDEKDDLDPHITIKDEEKEKPKNVMEDVSKLKKLLNK